MIHLNKETQTKKEINKMPWETLPDAVATTADYFGGQYLNRISQLLTGIDIAGTDATLKPLIVTESTFRTGKLYIQSSDLSHRIQLLNSGVTDTTFDFANYNAWNKDATETMTNKTLSLPVINGPTLGGNLYGTPTVPSSWVWVGTQIFPDNSGFGANASGHNALFATTGLTADRTFTFPDLSGTVGTLEASQSISGIKTFGNTSLLVSDGGTFAVTLKPLTQTAARILQIPALTGTDTVMVLGIDQLIGVAKRFESGILKIRTPDHNSALPITSTNNGGLSPNANIPALTTNDDFVFAAFAQTLSNKTLSTPTLTTPLLSSYEDFTRGSIPADPASGVSRQYSKQLTAHDDGIFVKQKEQGYIREAQINGYPRDSYRHYGYLNMQFATLGCGFLAGQVTQNTPTGGSNTAITNTAPSYKRLTSGTAAAGSASVRSNVAFTTRANNCVMNFKFRTENNNATTGSRVFVGFTSEIIAYAHTTDPLPSLSGFGLWFAPTVSTNYRYAYNNGSGTAIADFGTPIASDTNDHVCTIRADGTNNQWIIYLDGQAQVQSTGNIPAATTSLSYVAEIDSNDTTPTASNLRIYYLEIFCD